MSDEEAKITPREPDPDVVVLEKQNYERMMSTLRGLVGLSLGLGLTLTVIAVKRLTARKSS